ncbi:PREDICTED: putative leucine-rich repeat-containing protein DDB_G0290503 isoform X2 [Ipomoea nil]|uniref:putative leucine-rich repeat-containing protein DDB_G0290503 isoform X2 n=1 Tax=Ipomoea nil TaxID=35883 RepID=UPI00090156F2|nr:PREDICTED: putative leucine-rich repeat-containing protein DDB_G0290503 isoform X2 [Ipomoea nil]
MSRITKWKLEKNKVKVVFRLQFHATHIPQTGWDKLFISFIPADSGKTTAKTTKASVRNGSCKWADPIYETTRLLQDVKNKEYDEKLYKIVVAMGSSRASILGEATINLAEHADASKPSVVALPLHGGNTGTILHVTVQLLTSKTGFREFEQQRELRERGLQSGVDNKPDDTGPGKVSVSRDAARGEMEKGNRRARFRPDAKELSSVEEVEEYGDMAVGFDGSSNASESFYAEKNDASSMQETNSLKSAAFGDSNEPPNSQSPQPRQTTPSESQVVARGSNDSVHGWVSDCSMDNDLAIACDENNRLRGSLELAETSVFELKLEVSSLQSQANELGIEAEKFAHLLAAEISSGEELAKEVSVLKLECLKFKDDVERLQNLKTSPQSTEKQNVHADCGHLVQEVQVKWIKGILLLEDRIRDLQNKTYLGFHEREHRLLQSELEVMVQILQDIKQGSENEISLLNIVPPVITDVKEVRDPFLQKTEHPLPGLGLDLDLCPPVDILHHFSIPSLVSQGPDSLGAVDAMKTKIFDLIRELDEAKFERENLVKKMDQMECYYEALVQELEENQKQMLTELQSLRSEHSTCMYTISSSKAEMESLRQDMNLQILQLVDENRNLDAINKELEKRAASSEAALRRARMNYSIAVEKLQKDLELLSSQVVSMFQTNENLIKQAFLEPSMAEDLEYVNGLQYLESSDTTMQLQFHNQNLSTRKQSLCGDVLLEDLKKSLFLQEELYMKVEEDLNEMHSVNLYLDIYSKTLVETMLEADHSSVLMKKYMDELAQQLEFSNECRDQLMAKLQVALEDISILNEDKARFINKCNELVLQNQILVDKLEGISKENCLLTEKLMGVEVISAEYRNCLSKYEACLEEKAELSSLLEQGKLENGMLHTEISVLKEDLKIVESKLDNLVSSKENLQQNVSFVQDRLVNVLESYGEQFIGTPPLGKAHHPDLDLNNLKGLLLQVEEIQHKSCSKILQLMEDNKCLEAEKHASEVSLSRASSEILAVKQKFKNNIQDMAAKLGTSNALVEKLQFELETVANKLHFTSEVEEKHAQQNRELLADLSLLEVELQNLASRNGHVVQEILGLDSLADEIGRSSSTIAELLQENKDLMMSLQGKTEESVKLASEISSLKENLGSLNGELHSEIDSKAVLQARVQDLMSQLNEKHGSLSDLEKRNTELLQENKDLMMSLQGTTEECAKLGSEINGLKEKLGSLHGDLHSEIDSKAELQARVQDLMSQLNEKHGSLSDLEKHNTELIQENQDLMISLQVKTEESVKLGSEISGLEENLRSLHDELRSEKASKAAVEGKVQDLTFQLNEKCNCLLDLEKCNTKLIQEKQDLAMSLQGATEESSKLASEISCLKENLRSVHDEWHSERDFKAEHEGTIRDLTFQLNEKCNCLLDLEKCNTKLIQEKQDLVMSLQGATEESSKLASEISCLKENLRNLHDELHSERDSKSELEGTIRDLTFQLNEKHSSLHSIEKQNISVVQEKQDLIASLQGKTEESVKLASEIISLKDNLRCLHDELNSQKSSNSELEARLKDLSSKLSEEHLNVLHLEKLSTELAHFQEQASELEVEKSRLHNLLLQRDECIEKLKEDLSLLHALKSLELQMHESLIASDVKFTFAVNQYGTVVQGLVQQLELSDECLGDLRKQHDDLQAKFNQNFARKDHHSEENLKLLTALDTVRSDLEASLAQNKVLSDSNSATKARVEEYKNQITILEDGLSQAKRCHALEVEHLKDMLANAEEEIWYLIASKEELGIMVTVLRSKLDEQLPHMTLLEKYQDEQLTLQSQYNELAHKLSQQVLKTEEFRNLSVRLKELKDTAEAECVLAREKRESEGPPVARQESLRMAFIKEQYETKVQELKQQLSISKRHGEDMLLKLQDAVDETESRKRSDALHSKRNEELALKLLGLESELQEVLSDKREISKAHDRIKTELECAVLSLECSKEEKEKLEVSLQECMGECSRLAAELSVIKQQLENVKSQSTHKEVKHGSDESTKPSSPNSSHQENLISPEKLVDPCSNLAGESEDLTMLNQLQTAGGTMSVEGKLNSQHLSIEGLSSASIDFKNNHFGTQNLRASMEHLHEELERMKNENYLFPKDHHCDPDFQDSQRELVQLQKTNEDLRSMFPLFNEIATGGNALERVLALELELAEALKTKSKPNIFQSSFLKQHSDEEAIFKSFRDINAVIKEMLELKGRHAAMENELKEMHDRYSELSLQFAEVEGERQKLKMTLKNLRGSRKLTQINRTSSSIPAENSS